MDILENFTNNLLLFLPVGVPAYLVGALTVDYLLIYRPDRVPAFMLRGGMDIQQVEARNGNIVPLIISRLLTAISFVVAGSLASSINTGFFEAIKLQ